ncbi:peptidylprolyl isomerase [Exiguobacterium sp. MMG028]|uniref:peptidylprolyl isomerase n=1 Tax=Exiguobacterium sp. MMG028 TaxID=3021979 RepID=UPI0022FE0E3E|nr:peptidylprolyl isomerase [Exiguobacterium sp. MMG028]MDA5560492.1 peptidylprolyl isomerase [Exiguobacterium sp. MMG028]
MSNGMTNEPKKQDKKFSTGALVGASALALIIGAGGTYAATSAGGGESDNSAVVTYKGGEITRGEITDMSYDRMVPQLAFQETMNALLEKEYGDQVEQEKVDEEFSKTEEQFNSEEEFEQAIQQAGMSGTEEFKEALRGQMLVDAAKSELVDVTDEDIEAQFAKENTEVEASHILVESEEEAQDIIKQLNDGADFAELAKEKSTDTGSGEKGGELGFFSTGQMVPEFEEYAFQEDVVGKVSEPIQSQYGFHVIKVTDRKEKDLKLEDEKDRIREEVATEKLASVDANKVYAELIEKYNVDVKDAKAEQQFDAVKEAIKNADESSEESTEQ